MAKYWLSAFFFFVLAMGTVCPQTDPDSNSHTDPTPTPPLPPDFSSWNVVAWNPDTGTPEESAKATALQAKFAKITITQPILEAMKVHTLVGYFGKEAHPVESGGFIFDKSNPFHANPGEEMLGPTDTLAITYGTGPGLNPKIGGASVFIDEAFVEKFNLIGKAPLNMSNDGAWHSHHIYHRNSPGLLYPSGTGSNGGDVGTANGALTTYNKKFFLMPLAHIFPDQKQVRVRLYVFSTSTAKVADAYQPIWYPLQIAPESTPGMARWAIMTQIEQQFLGAPTQWYGQNGDIVNFVIGATGSSKLKSAVSKISVGRDDNSNLAMTLVLKSGNQAKVSFPQDFPKTAAALQIAADAPIMVKNPNSLDGTGGLGFSSEIATQVTDR